MSQGQPMTTWTCDRCGAQAVMEGRNQPRKWIGVQFCSPPLKDMADETRRHLCGDCDKAFADFMFGPTPEASR